MLKIYSPTLKAFMKRLEVLYREILINEVHVETTQGFFRYLGKWIPIQLAIFTSKQMLGYFNASRFEIGLNQTLIYETKSEVLKDIIRHEVAHLITYLHFGEQEEHHGEAFKLICLSFKWPLDRVGERAVDLSLANDRIEGDLKSEQVIAKVKKLLNLATSSNIHEAQLATAKANQLLLRHQLESLPGQSESDLLAYNKTILKFSRTSAKYQTISLILRHFMVYPVFYYTHRGVELEVTGDYASLQIAEYVATYLDQELERLWIEFKSKHPEMKGRVAKNSFLRGMAEGYQQKLDSIQNEEGGVPAHSLVLINNQLERQVELVHKRLAHSKHRYSHDEMAHQHGVNAGQKLTIYQGLQDSSKGARCFLVTHNT